MWGVFAGGGFRFASLSTMVAAYFKCVGSSSGGLAVLTKCHPPLCFFFPFNLRPLIQILI